MVLLANISGGRDFINEILALKSLNPEDNFEDLEERMLADGATMENQDSLYWDESE